MFDKIFGIPVHPLAIHATVVLVPALALAALAYIFLPRFRSKFTWLLVALAVVTPISTFVSVQSGKKFKARLTEEGRVSSQMAEKINTHQGFGQALLWWVLALGALTLIVVALNYWGPWSKAPQATTNADSADAEAPDTPAQPAKGNLALNLVFGALILILSLTSLYYVYRVGESGARMVWG